jgi:hypothetical protein
VLGQHLIDEDVAAADHRGLRGVLAGVAPPDENLVDLLALLAGCRQRLVGLDLMVRQLAATVVAVHGDQDAAAGVGDPVPAGGAAEPAEHLRVNDAQPGAGQHGDSQLGHHRHMQRHPVADLQPQRVAQHRRELVDMDAAASS